MMTCKLFIALSVVAGLLLTASLVSASPALAGQAPADTLQPARPGGGPAQTITYNEEVIVNNTLKANSAYIGSTEAGVGGVTFFNGSIVNNAVDDDGENTIPVTFADDVRIDGEIYRTEKGGDSPLKISDSILPVASNTYSLGITANKFKDGYFAGALSAGSITTTGSLTAASVTASGSVTAGSIVTSGTVDGIDVSAIPSTYVSQSSPSWDSRTGYVSITPGSCIPEEETTDYDFPLGSAGSYIEPVASGAYYCSMQLPHGATINSAKAYVKDSGANLIAVSLYQSQLTGYTYTNLGTRSSSGASGNQVINIDSLSETVDNSADAYFLVVNFLGSGTDYNFRGAIIEYSYTQPY